METTGNKDLFLLILTFLLGMALTLPIFTKVPPHADEHQFYFNAFKIMGAEELHNYVYGIRSEFPPGRSNRCDSIFWKVLWFNALYYGVFLLCSCTSKG